MAAKTRLPEILQRHQTSLVTEWLGRQREMLGHRSSDEREDRDFTERFLKALAGASQAGNVTDTDQAEWSGVREMLGDLSRARARQGYSALETAVFVLSLKQPLFDRLRQEIGKDPDALASELWVTTLLLDRLGLYTTEIHQKTREEVISRQQQELLELSTPVVQLWDGVLALPLIGTLDSSRTQVVMESLLQRIVETGSTIAIIDITGVPTVDTLVAQHLLKTVSAARLMGADCIISGIRPQIAQTIVHLGVELGDVSPKPRWPVRWRLRWPVWAWPSPACQGRRERAVMERIPILKMGDYLLVSIQVDMHDRLALALQDDLTERIVQHRAHGVLIDISALEIVDSFIGRMIGNIAAMARVLDAQTVVVGMRPAVAITLVELGLSLPGVHTALTVERGMARLRELLDTASPNGHPAS